MSRRNNYENNRARRTRKNWIGVTGIILAVVMLTTAALTGVGFATKSFEQNPFNKERNPDNLLTTECYMKNLTDEFDKGLNVKWNDDGSFVMSGKYEDDQIAKDARFVYEFASITLEAGDYTISTGNDNCKKDEFGLVVYYDGKTEYIGSEEFTLILDEESTVTVGLFVKNDLRLWSLSSKITPTLVAGTEAGEFYK